MGERIVLISRARPRGRRDRLDMQMEARILQVDWP